jgi:ribosomal protein S18 acetylase RimI-like enzyme
MADRPRIRLRRATLADVPGLVALENASFTTDRLSARQFRHHVTRGHSALVVAERGRTLLGDVLVLFRRGSRLARLYSLVVDASARGLGLGRRLLARAEDAACRAGCDAMRLEVRVDNGGAIALYAGAGYARIGTKVRFYEDGADAVVYLKRLRRRA